MKKEIIDNYEIYSENGKMIFGSFVDYLGEKHCFKIDDFLENEFIDRRRMEFNAQYETRKHLDTSIYNPHTLEVRALIKIRATEDSYIQNNFMEMVIKEIWKLPSPQNRRTYMKLIDGFSLTKIAKIEGRAIPVIKKSVDLGIEKIRTKLKKIRNF